MPFSQKEQVGRCHGDKKGKGEIQQWNGLCWKRPKAHPAPTPAACWVPQQSRPPRAHPAWPGFQRDGIQHSKALAIVTFLHSLPTSFSWALPNPPLSRALQPPNLAAFPGKGSSVRPDHSDGERPCRYRFRHVGSGRQRPERAAPFQPGLCSAHRARRRLGHRAHAAVTPTRSPSGCVRPAVTAASHRPADHRPAGSAEPAALPESTGPPPEWAWGGAHRARADYECPFPPPRQYLAVVAHEHDAVARVNGPGAEVALLDPHGRAEPIRRPRRKRSLSWPEAADRVPHSAPWRSLGANAAAKRSPRGAGAEL